MAVFVEVLNSTGRAKCQICDKIIAKGVRQIKISGWRTGCSIHSNPEDCNKSMRLQMDKPHEEEKPKKSWLEG